MTTGLLAVSKHTLQANGEGPAVVGSSPGAADDVDAEADADAGSGIGCARSWLLSLMAVPRMCVARVPPNNHSSVSGEEWVAGASPYSLRRRRGMFRARL